MCELNTMSGRCKVLSVYALTGVLHVLVRQPVDHVLLGAHGRCDRAHGDYARCVRSSLGKPRMHTCYGELTCTQLQALAGSVMI